MKLIFTCFKSLSLAGLLFATSSLNLNALAQDKQLPTANDIPNTCEEDLAIAIEKIINRPEQLRSRWGIEVQTLEGETIYSLAGDKFFTPASNAKLLTTAAVLSLLDADYRLVTPILGVGNAPNLTSLRLKGQGDPSLTTENLKTIVHQLQALGVKRIEKLIVDDSYFASPAINPTWEWLDVHSYFATAVNSAILNQNTVTLTLLPQRLGKPIKYYWSDIIAGRQWRVINQGITAAKDTPYNIEIDGDLGQPLLKIRGELAINEAADIWDLAVVDPGNYFLESFRLYLAQAGIEVRQGIVIDKSTQYEGEKQLLEIVGPSIQQIIARINQESNNLYAEASALVLAKQFEQESGIEAIELGLTKLGINSNEYVLIDGSGLSRQNLITPQTLVKTLRLVSQVYESESYRQSLAIAGNSGTLKRRFVNTIVEDNFWGKTGTLTGVGSLSGYLRVPDRSTLVLSIVVNNSELSSQEIRQAIDEVTVAISHKHQC